MLKTIYLRLYYTFSLMIIFATYFDLNFKFDNSHLT